MGGVFHQGVQGGNVTPGSLVKWTDTALLLSLHESIATARFWPRLRSSRLQIGTFSHTAESAGSQVCFCFSATVYQKLNSTSLTDHSCKMLLLCLLENISTFPNTSVLMNSDRINKRKNYICTLEQCCPVLFLLCFPPNVCSV